MNEGEDLVSGRIRPWLCLAAGAVLAGCASPSIESAHFGAGADVETAIKRHYANNASEKHGHCPRPYLDAITGVEVVEDTPERLVAEVRYHFRDRIREAAGDEGEGSVPCAGFGERTFTVTGNGDGPRVVDMSGPQGKTWLRSQAEDLL